MDGLEFIRAIRKTSVVPIVVVSARTTEQDKIFALDLGANDYITKPFGTGELLARVRAALRNSRHSAAMGAVPGGTFSAASDDRLRPQAGLDLRSGNQTDADRI